MPSNTLQGLNIVYPPPLPSDNSTQDILTPPPGFPDISAQLDLWTHLSFASDEPFVDKDRSRRDFHPNLDHIDQDLAEGDEVEENDEKNEQNLILDADKPVQLSPGNQIPALSIPDQASTPKDQASFDLRSFLAGFGIDPFLVPPQHSSSLQSDAPSIPQHTQPSASSSQTDVHPPAKRSRTRKGSTTSNAQVTPPSALQHPAISHASPTTPEFSDDHKPLSTPLTAAEDKRRRNTAASARFRAKKKEREQALERRSKELESKVTELERECEGLRRENGWLKGLVVGVTGSNPSEVPQLPVDTNMSGNKSGSETTKGKRKRDADTSSEDR